MSRAIWKLKVDTVLAREKEMEFPQFMKSLRMLLGFKRKVVANDIGISDAKLLDIEYGNFTYMLKDELVKSLADYYEVPYDFLYGKCQDYCERSKKFRGGHDPFKKNEEMQPLQTRVAAS